MTAKKTIKHYISPSFWNSAPPRTSLNVSHSWKQSLRCECMSTYMCVFCRSCAVFSIVLLIVTLTLSESKSIRCPTIFLSSLLLLHVQCSQLRRIIPVYISLLLVTAFAQNTTISVVGTCAAMIFFRYPRHFYRIFFQLVKYILLHSSRVEVYNICVCVCLLLSNIRSRAHAFNSI